VLLGEGPILLPAELDHNVTVTQALKKGCIEEIESRLSPHNLNLNKFNRFSGRALDTFHVI